MRCGAVARRPRGRGPVRLSLFKAVTIRSRGVFRVPVGCHGPSEAAVSDTPRSRATAAEGAGCESTLKSTLGGSAIADTIVNA
ncbi:hypothetical protein NDU88_001346 [Pleurodeles waltl]|uniref:Uncharacterized protein n=1 Tax=Pleurodeles waltl TaxID=8319 RepID=A0AAV7U644_PLEWA|nr:hypothetical protein NDU88_001346 [Pleurodeles waltl]